MEHVTDDEVAALIKGKRCATVNGFSLHANTAINSLQRDRLSQLIKYIARGPLSNERLKIRDDGKVVLQLKSKWADGTSHLLFIPGECIEKNLQPSSHLPKLILSPEAKPLHHTR